MNPDDLRKGQEALAGLARNELVSLFARVENATQAGVALQDVLPALVRTYGSAAATFAADWYDEARREADVRGRFSAIPADLDDAGSAELAGWAASQGTTTEAILALAAGGLVRRIMNYSRDTVAGSSLADPAADGWQRAGLGSCAFCAMLIGRGAVYSERSADFASHDDCHCSAVPAFRGRPRPVRPYSPGPRHGSEADYARAKAWIANH